MPGPGCFMMRSLPARRLAARRCELVRCSRRSPRILIEVSPFPYYLTEINLLLQVSRLLGALAHEGREVPSFVLSVVHEDALKAKPTAATSLEGLAPEQRADHAL